MRSVEVSGMGRVGVLVALALNLPADGLLIGLAWLRETPPFWTSEGGYPVWARDWVLVGFPVLLGLEVIFLLVMTLALVRHGRGQGSGVRVSAVLLVTQWLGLACVFLMLGWNNMENLLEGRSLHWKPH